MKKLILLALWVPQLIFAQNDSISYNRSPFSENFQKQAIQNKNNEIHIELLESSSTMKHRKKGPLVLKQLPSPIGEFGLNLVTGNEGLKQKGFTFGVRLDVAMKNSTAPAMFYAGLGAGRFQKSYTENNTNHIGMKEWDSYIIGASFKLACRL